MESQRRTRSKPNCVEVQGSLSQRIPKECAWALQPLSAPA